MADSALYLWPAGQVVTNQEIDQAPAALSGQADVGAIQLASPTANPGAITATVLSEAGNLDGAYQYAMTETVGLIDGNGNLHPAGETAAGTASNVVNPSSNPVSLSLPAPTSLTISRTIWRTDAGGSTFYFLVTLVDPQVSTWTDNVADANLGTTTVPAVNTTGTVLQLPVFSAVPGFSAAAGTIIAVTVVSGATEIYRSDGSGWAPITPIATTTTPGIVKISAAPTSGNPVAVTTVDPYYLELIAQDVVNFAATNTNSGANITLTWTNPTSSDFTGRSVFASTTSLANASYASCVANATLISSGLGTGAGALDDYAYAVTLGTTYYFKIFADYITLGNAVESAGVATSLLAQDTTPPGNVTADTATPGNTEVTITWTDPTTAGWAGTLLLRKTGSYPVDQNDGTVVVNSTVSDQYATTGYVDSGLTNGTQYFYQLFPYNTSGYYNTNAANQLTATPENFILYGVSWDTSTGVVTRIDNAAGLTQSDFNTLAPWSDLQRCDLSPAGVINAYYGNAGYTENGTNGQAMVQIPAFYYRMTTTTSGFTFEIATGAAPGFTLHPAFYRDRTGSGVASAVAYRYCSAYEGVSNGTILQSIIGSVPTASEDIDTFRGLAQAIGNGWGVSDFNLMYALQLLYLIEYASFDSQTELGQGYTASTNTAPIATGATSSLGNTSTVGSDSAQTTGTAAMSYRGVENWYGNIFKWLDGYVTSGTSGTTPITIMIGNAAFNDTGSGYTTSYTSSADWTNGGGYESDIWGVPALGFTPNAFAGSSTTGLFDYGFLASGCLPLFGGNWEPGVNAGAFSLDVGSSAASVYSDVGARLAF